MYAVIRTGGKQYRVAENDVISVEKLPGTAGETVELGDVLMLGNGAETEIGAPLVAGARVVATILEQTRGPKIIVFKKKRRKNYRLKKGHRQDVTVLRITGIEGAGAKPAKAKKAAEPKPAKAKETAEPKPATAKETAEPKPAKAKKAAEPKPAKAKKAAAAKAEKPGKPAAAKPAKAPGAAKAPAGKGASRTAKSSTPAKKSAKTKATRSGGKSTGEKT